MSHRNPTVYHGARHLFEGMPKAVDGFAVHVGTIGAARARLRHTTKAATAKRLFEIEIDPKKVLEAPDCGYWDDAYYIMDSLTSHGSTLHRQADVDPAGVADAFGIVPTYAEDDRPVPRDKWSGFWVISALRHATPLPTSKEPARTNGVTWVRKALLKLGYQAIAYVNRFEAKGSVSFAIIDPSCITNWREVVGPVKKTKS